MGGDHLVQGLLVLEATRNLLATVNQLRSALASETLGYLRTVYEIYVKSRFLAGFAGVDADLPGKFSYFTNSYAGFSVAWRRTNLCPDTVHSLTQNRQSLFSP